MAEDVELYIHIPFCVRKCNYCDFLSFSADESVQDAYATQIINELTYRSGLAAGYTVSSCYIGGGTPSVISEWHIYDIMDTIARNYSLSEDAEITIECNPSSVLRHKLAVYRKAGVNRLSLGLQSADNSELRLLGRVHSFEEFLKSYQSARMEDFDNINVDLISCFPMQSMKTWRKTLRTICMLKPEHISVYNLIIEEGTPFYSMREKGLLMMPSEDEQAAMDSFTRSCLERYGYKRYEFSNYSRPGRACRHNIGYWTGVPYLGFGIGAASYFGGFRWKNVTDIRDYFQIDFSRAFSENDYRAEDSAAFCGHTAAVEKDAGTGTHESGSRAASGHTAAAGKGSEPGKGAGAAPGTGMNAAITDTDNAVDAAITDTDSVMDDAAITDAGSSMEAAMDGAIEKRLRRQVERLSREDRMEEFVYLGMRLTSGISEEKFKSTFGVSIEEIYGDVLEKYISMGLIEHNGDILRLTDRGIDVSNVVLADFLLD